MSLVYTITSGYLECENEKFEIPFALVFLEQGIYRIELILPNDEIYQKYKFNHYYKIVGITEKKYNIECSHLYLTKHNSDNNKVAFKSEGHIKLIKPETYGAPSETEEDNYRDKIWFIELENLKTCFADYTYIKRSKDFSELDEIFTDSILDHTETPWVINNLEKNGNYFRFRLIQKKNSENLLLDFREDNGYCKLHYDEYLSIRNDIISLLSFMNGGIVKIRKEYTGEYYGQSDKGHHSHTEINYSFLNKYDDSYNNYLQINFHHSYSNDIYSEIFLNCFRRFQYYNTILDLDSLIFSLNVSSQTIGLKERYFILITALEKIAKKYSEAYNTESKHLIEDTFFQNNIKPKLLESIIPVKDIDKDVWGRMNSILSNLNNNNSSSKILYDFLIFSKIPISGSVKKLIKKERNQAVHEGKIGNNSQEMYNNYLKLDHILRDVILNIIGYFGNRNRKGYYATLKELEYSNPKLDNEVFKYIIK